MKQIRIFAVAAFALATAFLTPVAQAALPAMQTEQGVPTLAPMIKQVTPAVVNISTKGHVEVQQNPLLNDPFFRHFFNVPEQPQQREYQALGSGVIVDAKNGYILTNNHVIEHADEITVKLNDDREFDAKVIGADPETDVAVIKIDAKNLTQVPLGNSSQLQVGDFVVAIGNPFGLEHTVTSGIVSGLGRVGLNLNDQNSYQDFIQTDASINPGNSGGALVNLRGELVGINTAILSRSGGNIGIGFAIPINMAQTVMNQLIKNGKIERGVLGVSIQNLTPELADALGLKNVTHGAVVGQVTPGSGADKAGIKQGDVIIEANGKKVANLFDLKNVIGLLPVGSRVDLKVIRDGETRSITATIGSATEGAVSASGIVPALKGVQISELNENSPLFGQVKGVQVTSVDSDSVAYDRGLRAGDVITEVNRQPVTNMAQFRKAVANNKGSLLLTVRKGNGVLFLVLPNGGK